MLLMDTHLQNMKDATFTALILSIVICYCYVVICDNIFFFTQEKVKAVFDNLIQLEHLNIVKFHKYWADVKENRARVRDHLRNLLFLSNHIKSVECNGICAYVFALLSFYFFCLQVIFITEYMSSGSLKQFLKKTKKNHKTMNEKV